MYATLEIRWFTPQGLPAVEAWFAARGLSFAKNATRRTDFYLPQPGRDDCGIKLREGDVEVKQRMGHPMALQATPQAAGWLESWQKWPFRYAPRDPQARQILNGNTEWLAVEKERMALKASSNERGLMRFFVLPASRLHAGFQLEYTRLYVRGETWFTVAAEAFGPQLLPLPQSLLADLLGDSSLPPESSLSYPGWLQALGANRG